MIFVTVGAQMPFDRLVKAVDDWAADRGRRDVFAQIGPTPWRPSHIQWKPFLTPAEFREKVLAATVVVAHAGMGSIITALEVGKPILVMPRSGALMETRNDHQLATARQFLAQGRTAVAFDERELVEKLDRIGELGAGQKISTEASPLLLSVLRSFASRGTFPRPTGVALPERFADMPFGDREVVPAKRTGDRAVAVLGGPRGGAGRGL
jgi:UDP-N-acetylglucosamine transferase subunit ALG13